MQLCINCADSKSIKNNNRVAEVGANEVARVANARMRCDQPKHLVGKAVYLEDRDCGEV